tara:strand:+ start:103 stop:369 length:267 start_codon:yes stop_codon:yes gene_type:complete
MWKDVLKGERLTMGAIRQVYNALDENPRTIKEISEDIGVHFNTVMHALKKIMAREHIYPGVRKKVSSIYREGKPEGYTRYAYYIGELK